MRGAYSYSPGRGFLCLIALLFTSICTACGGATGAGHTHQEATKKRTSAVAIAASPPSGFAHREGRIFVATQPSVGNGGTVSALLSNSGTQLWSVRTLVTYLSMTIDQGVVYVAGSQLSTAGQSRVYALSAVDGSLLWSTQLPVPGLSVPLIESGTVYVASPLDGTIFALRGADGSFLWRSITGLAGAGTSPMLLWHGLLYVGSHGSGTVVGLRCSDGQMVWSDTSGQMGVSNLVLSSGTLFFLGGSLDGTLPAEVHAVRGGDGTELWHRSVGPASILSLALSQGVLYFSAEKDALLAVGANDGSLLWRTPLVGVDSGIASFQLASRVVYAVANMGRGVFALRANDGVLLWKYQDLQSAPVWGMTVGDAVTYVLGDGGTGATLYALETTTGSQLWHSSLPSGSSLQSTIGVLHGAVVVVLPSTGTLYMQDSEGKEEWTRDLHCSDPVAPFPLDVVQ